MYRVLVVDDEEGIRKNIERLLKLEGFEVATAANGHHGFVLAKSMLPDLIVTDINMPVMDGFAMVEAVRGHPELATTTIIMLTAAEDRSNMRRGMSVGADDYLTKPFRREELLDAIEAQRAKAQRFNKNREDAVTRAVTRTEERVERIFRSRYDESLPSVSDSLPAAITGGDASLVGTSIHATMLFADIRGFTTMAERLSAKELALLLGEYFEAACTPVVQAGGTHLKMMGDGLMAMFEDVSAEHESNHARRALVAALGLKAAARHFGETALVKFSNRGLAAFSVGIGVHSGEVSLGRLGALGSNEITPLGDTVNIAQRLQTVSKELGWTLAVSIDSVGEAGAGVKTGRDQEIALRGRASPIHACEVMGLHTHPALDLQFGNTEGGAQLDSGSRMSGMLGTNGHMSSGARMAYTGDEVKSAAKAASEMTARAAKDALRQSLWSLQSGRFSIEHPKRFKGYQVLRKLGEGGMSDVYLAKSDADQSDVVLKVLRTSAHNDADMLRRFIQEYAVLATIKHHHVAKIYDQGFTDEYAYITMEYLSGGTLKEEISRLPDHTRVVDLMRQVASSLHAVHQLGLVYRDLKPENLMFRGSGELVLVDFGIVKSVGGNDSQLVQTLHGQIVGTPYYVSPEQASGKEVNHQADFYSLGVMLYELLTGDKPYRAESLEMLLAKHIHGETPRLPAEHAVFQPMLNQLMAKNPADRPHSAHAIFEALAHFSSVGGRKANRPQ